MSSYGITNRKAHSYFLTKINCHKKERSLLDMKASSSTIISKRKGFGKRSDGNKKKHFEIKFENREMGPKRKRTLSK